jgi:hypothetical protein
VANKSRKVQNRANARTPPLACGRPGDSALPDRFAKDRSVGCTFDLRIDQLAAGQHLLTVIITQGGQSATRNVRFTVARAGS